MQNLAEYLASEQARENVKALLAKPCPQVMPGDPVGWRHYGIQALPHPAPPSPWIGVAADYGGRAIALPDWRTISAYYRPDGDRYVVTDLGEGVRALRIKGVALLDIKPRVDAVMMAMWQEQTEFVAHFPAALIEGEIGTVNHPKADQLPDAICRVMLASLRVAQS